MKNVQKPFKPGISEDFEEYRQIGSESEPYIASKALIEALNLAIFLERPLLLKGEPGCGKTRFAEAVAFELYKESYVNYYEEWYIKSTTKAQDGLYTFDHIGRLSDAQLSHSKYVDEELVQRLKTPESYFNLAELGRSFQSDKPKVVLIDEIDKADMDFPNDLLLELDRKKFFVHELIQGGKKKEVKAEQSLPIIIITSNDEKELPAPFLRRCLFHYIEFPSDKQLEQIVRSHFDKDPEDSLVAAVVQTFLQLRKAMKEDKKETEKKVSTSELLDWFRVLNARRAELGIDGQALQKIGHLPFSSVLLKNWEDHLNYFKNQKHLKS